MTPVLPATVFRVSRHDYCDTTANALSGIGGLHDDGRWHSRGSKIIYTAQSSTLCLFERLVHADEWMADRASDRVMIELAVPSISWTHVTSAELAAEDPKWRSEGNPLCRKLGNVWLRERMSCALMVPSAANPGDFNVLFNPEHDEFRAVLGANSPLQMTSVELDERVVSLAKARRAAGV